MLTSIDSTGASVSKVRTTCLLRMSNALGIRRRDKAGLEGGAQKEERKHAHMPCIRANTQNMPRKGPWVCNTGPTHMMPLLSARLHSSRLSFWIQVRHRMPVLCTGRVSGAASGLATSNRRTNFSMPARV